MDPKAQVDDTTFSDLLESLQQPFPKEAVKHRKISDSLTISYIETDNYVERLNQMAGQHWSWRLSNDPVFYDRDVLVIGTLTIMGAKRDGIGTAPLKNQDGRTTNLKYALRSASQDALRDACDLFGMGWTNLKGSRSKQQKHRNATAGVAVPTCQKCQEPLSESQITWLKEHHITLYFCENCVPAHFKKDI
ncbi:Rad52/Rad22 family DNA repair protein [Bacillus piscicola]|uniref:Rad52/Rad22 family DNA repair protein n=1 Tax=Bacillus piscicola TaxID=1632684 RepID=UPI001F0974F3